MKVAVSRHSSILLMAGLFLAGNLGFFLWYRSTTQQRKKGMELRRDTLVHEVETQEKEAAVLASQRDRLSNVSEAIDEFYGKRIGSSRETLAPIVTEIHTLLSKAGIAPLQVSYQTRPLVNLPLTEMVIAFGFRNDYNQLKQLLASIESDRKWLVVRDVALSRDKDLPGAVQVRMTLVTYFTRSEGEAPPRPSDVLSQAPARAPVARAGARERGGASR
jgi:Tfp pilus assembly protein PilO